MVEKGTMRLYPNVRPALRAGRYEMKLEQTIENRDGSRIKDVGGIDAVTKHVEVTAPRFSMPGSEIFSVYPPPNAAGAFSTRLPQVVLKRRTLPWERKVAPDHPDEALPWLALVVLAEGEAHFLPNLPIEEALPADLRSKIGVTESGRCDVVEVPERVIASVFPAQEELKLLCHAREVNVSDTEYADRDGWVSVVISNRLPREGTSYRAYLISLEGQFDLLPKDPAVQDDIGPALVFRPEELARMTQVLAPASASAAAAPTVAAAAPTVAATAVEAGRIGVKLDAPALEALSQLQASGFLVHAVDFGAAVEAAVRTTHRFPVLAKWDFRCETGGDFQYLMENLDVGLIGTAPKRVDPEDARERVAVAPTGHSFIDHLTRRGQTVRSWYRGPLVPREVERRGPQTFHVADQARSIGEDGLENLSEAAAFEVGRLLALSDQRFLAMLHEWRRRSLFAALQTAQVLRLTGLREVDATFGIGRGMDVRILTEVASVLPEKVQAIRDPFGVGDLLEHDAAKLAAGLALTPQVVASALSPELTTVPLDRASLQVAESTDFDAIVAHPAEIAPLMATLEGMKAALARKAHVEPREPAPDDGAPAEPAPDDGAPAEPAPGEPGPVVPGAATEVVTPSAVTVAAEEIKDAGELLGVIWPGMFGPGPRERGPQ